MSLLGLGGGMIVNGLMNALVSSINSRKTLAANAEQQQKNMEFQEALQKKQWSHAEKLQQEMREMTRRNFLEQIQHQQQTADWQDLAQRWPLPATSPRLINKEFDEYLQAEVPIPLQLIIVENGDLGKGPLAIRLQIRNAINELNKFMSAHYGRNSAYAVKIYDTDKAGANFGAAEVDTVFQVFKVAPTMILTIRVEGSCYRMECWHWGSGSVIKPAMAEIFTCNVQDLQLGILRQIAAEWNIIKSQLQLEDPDKDELVDLIRRIDTEQKRLIQNGASPELLQEYTYKPFLPEIAQFTTPNAPATDKSKKINAAPFIHKINAGIEQSILSSFKICSALLADAHFLLEYKTAPRFMQICADELQTTPQLMHQAESFFTAALNALPDYRKMDTALMNARMATAYQEADRPEEALLYTKKCSRLLEQMVSPHHFALEASGEMLICLDELKQIKGAKEQIPWLCEQASKKYTPDEMNQHAASMYQAGKIDEAITIWRKAVDLGHEKSMQNIAVVLESVGRLDEANEMYEVAIKHGVSKVFRKGHQVALWNCNRGNWANAFTMWCFYLQSKEKTYKHEAAANSALLLFTSAISEIFADDCALWASLLHLKYCDDNPQLMAEDFLLASATSDSYTASEIIPFYDALSTWYLKSKGYALPLIYGVNNDIKLQYTLPQQLSYENEVLFNSFILKSGRYDIKQLEKN